MMRSLHCPPPRTIAVAAQTRGAAQCSGVVIWDPSAQTSIARIKIREAELLVQPQETSQRRRQRRVGSQRRPQAPPCTAAEWQAAQAALQSPPRQPLFRCATTCSRCVADQRQTAQLPRQVAATQARASRVPAMLARGPSLPERHPALPSQRPRACALSPRAADQQA